MRPDILIQDTSKNDYAFHLTPKVPFITVINKESRTDRLGEITRHIFSTTEEDIIQVFNGMSGGLQGLKRTMKVVARYLYNFGPQRNLVLEDDAEFTANYKDHAFLLGHNLPRDFDLLYLGCNLLMPPEKYAEDTLKVKGAYASHAILYNKRTLKFIYENLDTESDEPYDLWLNREIVSKGNSFCTYPMLANQRPSRSDIADVESMRVGPAKDYVEGDIIRWDKMMNERFEQMTKNL